MFASEDLTFGKSNYLACNGGSLGTDGSGDGMFRASQVFSCRIRDIADGTSNTVAVGEVATNETLNF